MPVRIPVRIKDNHPFGWKSHLLWGVCLYLGFILANLPIAFLYQYLAPYAPPIHIGHLSGTPWSGQAKPIKIGPITLDQLRWQLLWSEMVAGRLSVKVQWDNKHQTRHTSPEGERNLPSKTGKEYDKHLLTENATARLYKPASTGHIVVSLVATSMIDQPLLWLNKGKLDLSLPWLADQLAFIPPGTTGEIHLSLDSLRLDVNQARIQQLESTIQLTNIRIGSPINLPLGDFDLYARQSEEGGVRLVIQDQQAVINIKATMQLHLNGSYRILGTVKPGDPTNERIIALLRFMGQPGIDGRVALDLNGMLAF